MLNRQLASNLIWQIRLIKILKVHVEKNAQQRGARENNLNTKGKRQKGALKQEDFEIER